MQQDVKLSCSNNKGDACVGLGVQVPEFTLFEREEQKEMMTIEGVSEGMDNYFEVRR